MEINDYDPNEDNKPMATITAYRNTNNLKKWQFCARFGYHKENYHRDFGGDRKWVVIQSRKSDKLMEVKAEYIKNEQIR